MHFDHKNIQRLGIIRDFLLEDSEYAMLEINAVD